MSETMTALEGRALLSLARGAIEDELFANGALAAARGANEISPALALARAVFVTLESREPEGELALRGCIGSMEARLPVHEAVVAAALEAAFEDPRFTPLTREEYPAIVVSVSVLAPPVPVPSPDPIVVGRHGVILECDGRRALFLPEVASRLGWTSGVLLEQLARKAGLPAEAWRRAKLATFESQHFAEGEHGG